MNPLNGLTLFYQEESPPHSGQPLVLGKKDKVLLIQGRTGAGKTLLARRIAGQAYKKGIKVCVMSDKEPHCHEYSGRNLTEVTCDGKTGQLPRRRASRLGRGRDSRDSPIGEVVAGTPSIMGG